MRNKFFFHKIPGKIGELVKLGGNGVLVGIIKGTFGIITDIFYVIYNLMRDNNFPSQGKKWFLCCRTLGKLRQCSIEFHEESQKSPS